MRGWEDARREERKGGVRGAGGAVNADPIFSQVTSRGQPEVRRMYTIQ